MQSVWRRIVPLLPALIAISAWQAWDSVRKGESVWVSVLAAVILVGLLATVARFLRRHFEGLSHKEALARYAVRLHRLHRWAAVLAVAGVAVRLVAYFAGLQAE